MLSKYNLGDYVVWLYSAAIRKAGDSHAAEDIVQETFLAAVTALSKGKKPEDLKSWLLRILSNKYCDWLREKYNKPQISIEDYPFDIREEDKLDDDSAEKLESIRRELGYLAKTHREVMIRFYMHGDTIEKISKDLQIPVGTVKSRLNTGRRHIREGVAVMENYSKQSYEPDILRISGSGGSGLDDEPFSLVGDADKLTQNVLILAYPKPVTETELAKALGVPAAYIEPIIEKMINGELMQRTEGGKVYTDFIIYTESDRKAPFKKQLEIVDRHFDSFWNGTENALAELRQKEYYTRQNEHAKTKLELHFCVKLLVNAQIDVMETVTGVISYSDYPYRKNGGRWLALGHQYPSDYDSKSDNEFWKYAISGEAGAEIKNFRDSKYIELRNYDTELGRYPGRYLNAEYIKWFYELISGVPSEESSIGDHVLEAADSLIENGILIKDGVLKLDIPILDRVEYQGESKLISEYAKKLGNDIRAVLLPVFETGAVKLPQHLKSVMKWQQYMFCSGSVPMAVIHKAIERELFLLNAHYRIPACVLIISKD